MVEVLGLMVASQCVSLRQDNLPTLGSDTAQREVPLRSEGQGLANRQAGCGSSHCGYQPRALWGSRLKGEFLRVSRYGNAFNRHTLMRRCSCR